MNHRIAQLAALLSLTFTLAASATAAPSRTAAASATIATVSSADFRADVVARRSSGGSAPTAIVVLTTFDRSGATWRKLASRRLAGSFFWNVVSGPRAICRLELASARRPHVTVQLLLTPSLGCGKTTTVQLPAR